MSTDLLNKVLRFGEGRQIKQMQARVAAIGDREPELERLSDDELLTRSQGLREQVANGADLDDILVDTFALVREVGRRAMGMRLYDVQMIGAQVLHAGRIAEMKTGEGKTFSATAATPSGCVRSTAGSA